MVWFKVEATALSDGRIRLLGARLGIGFDAAFVACCRIWSWLYEQGGDQVMPAEDMDVLSMHPGFAHAFVATGLGAEEPEGIRIRGGWRAKKAAEFRDWQRTKSALAAEARKVMANTKEHPRVYPRKTQGGSVLSLDLDLSQSLPEGQTSLTLPDSGVARANQQAKRLAAQEACGSWVEWFNRRFARSFRVTQELTKLVAALLARGYSEKPDMRGVALYLRSRWEDDERMAPYLVPSTILRPTKFPERLDLAREWDRESGGNIWQVQS